MGKHLESTLGKGTAGTQGRADWRKKKTDCILSVMDKCMIL